MATSQSEGRMEGWLHLIRSNRFGLQYSRKRYFLLEGHCLKSFKSVPISSNEVHARVFPPCSSLFDVVDLMLVLILVSLNALFYDSYVFLKDHDM